MENNEILRMISEMIKFGIVIFIFVFAWIFLRRLTKALTAMGQVEEHHEELMEKLDELQDKIDKLESGLRDRNNTVS
ncbi:MAG: hypothetical protein CFE23_02695 [Flavobacterium sp. BFFFF1]|uniref:hypothetical protein n=1 Tax=unclassified Flavobacterium TaxID=196869 RepID=UPI000BCABA66|nr:MULTISPECIES: hypothetical protein [unclassified Flavobacterium]OYU81808.1 MAG: hypothetical protein CFE23_02695 [Flavobacterium sp. BFFFF1]